MECQTCKSPRVANINAKCADRCWARVGEHGDTDYVPTDMGIGGGDYITFYYCLNCGQIQGEFPLETCELELAEEDEED